MRKQLQELDNTRAVLSARTMQAANGRAIYKQKCAKYNSGVRRQNKHNDRLLQMHKTYSENAARAGLPPPAVPELDNHVLQRPELSACMHELYAQPEHAEAAHEEPIPNTQPPADVEESTPDAHWWARDSP